MGIERKEVKYVLSPTVKPLTFEDARAILQKEAGDGWRVEEVVAYHDKYFNTFVYSGIATKREEPTW